MITGGDITKNRLSLTTESDFDAKLVKGGLAGRNNYLVIPPYGNKLNFKIEGYNIIVTKDDKRIFTFEEVHSLIKKIQMFGRIGKNTMSDIINHARTLLPVKLTLFLPNEVHPAVEVAFAYNWASIEFESEDFNKIMPEVKRKVNKTSEPSIKVFSNNVDIITFHNYAMDGIYIDSSSFDGMADVLIENRIINRASKSIFITRSCAFGVKSVAYMEARKLSRTNDDMFDIHQKEKLGIEIGDVDYFITLMDSFASLSEDGRFSQLNDNQIKQLYEIIENPQVLGQHDMPESIVHSVKGFVADFSTEITQMVQ